ncbi:MAG: hypothetical protein OSA42_07885, partial [Porticoccaceae bacterium]|nr:hypothetical protein [Porticoccaceae bacterium]
CTKDNWPMGVIMTMLWYDGKAWLTASGQRHRVSAVRRNPQVSVVLTSKGTSMGPNKTITLKGRCVVHDSREIKDWFYPKFALRRCDGNTAAAVDFLKMLDSPMRVVLEVVPEKFITYDGAKLEAHTQGKLKSEQMSAMSESDRVRHSAIGAQEKIDE